MGKHPVKVLERGRVTIPKEVRDSMDLEKGDYVVIAVEEFDHE